MDCKNLQELIPSLVQQIARFRLDVLSLYNKQQYAYDSLEQIQPLQAKRTFGGQQKFCKSSLLQEQMSLLAEADKMDTEVFKAQVASKLHGYTTRRFYVDIHNTSQACSIVKYKLDQTLYALPRFVEFNKYKQDLTEKAYYVISSDKPYTIRIGNRTLSRIGITELQNVDGKQITVEAADNFDVYANKILATEDIKLTVTGRGLVDVILVLYAPMLVTVQSGNERFIALSNSANVVVFTTLVQQEKEFTVSMKQLNPEDAIFEGIIRDARWQMHA